MSQIVTFFVPVVDQNQKPLMPTVLSRAKKWIVSGKATPFWKKGVFCVRLNQEPSDNQVQEIAVGIDPGSKKEGFTVKSEAHTFLNIQADAVDWVMKRMQRRKNARKFRRYRKTPCKKGRLNRASLKRRVLCPSIKVRWQWKLRIVSWLSKIFSISLFVVEDIKAVSKKRQKKWNESFSPLQVGKNWFYKELIQYSKDKIIIKKLGYETKELRVSHGLHKTSSKLSKSFDAHCVDSWVLANYWVGGHTKPDNKKILYIKPLMMFKRQLHVFQPSKNGKRKRFGGTISCGLKKGSLVKHLKYGVTYVGGFSDDKITLNKVEKGTKDLRITNNAKKEDCKFLCYNSWITSNK